jgi:hypothetical protein
MIRTVAVSIPPLSQRRFHQRDIAGDIDWNAPPSLDDRTADTVAVFERAELFQLLCAFRWGLLESGEFQ